MDIKLKKSDDKIRESFFSLESNSDIADLLEIDLKTLLYYCYRLSKDLQYRTYEIPKRGGRARIINAPISNLKILQQKLNYVFQTVYNPRECSYAFTKDRSIVENASEHKGAKVILKIDLEDFFNQIHFGRIKGLFMAEKPFGFNEEVAMTLANICVYKGVLPQGAPTSPMISNMICWSLDRDLQKLCRRYRCKYTRYADDITISSVNKEKIKIHSDLAQDLDGDVVLGENLQACFDKNCFKVNFDKVKIATSNKRQTVTGLVINEIVNVPHEYIDDIRFKLNVWNKYGIAELNKNYHTSINKNPNRAVNNVVWSLRGRLNFLKQVKSTNPRKGQRNVYKKLQKWFDYLLIRDKFYKLSVGNDYQMRGYALESILNELSKLNNITFESPFTRREGADQIDGAIKLPTYGAIIVECKWKQGTDDLKHDLDSLQGNISRSGGSPYGLFISMAGINKHTIKNLKEGKEKDIILMTGDELKEVIENRGISLKKVLENKLHNLNTRSEPFTFLGE